MIKHNNIQKKCKLDSFLIYKSNKINSANTIGWIKNVTGYSRYKALRRIFRSYLHFRCCVTKKHAVSGVKIRFFLT